MNELFERFIGESLKRAVGAGWRVRLQDHSHSALRDDADKDASGKPKPLFNLQPDAVIEPPPAGENGPPTVLDTKWKRLTPHKPSCERTLGVDQSDVYQMLAYARAYGAGRLILLYPWHKALGEHGEPDKKGRILRTWTVAEPGTTDEGSETAASGGEAREHGLGEPGTTAEGSETACRLDVAVVDVGSPGAVAPGAVARALRTIVDPGAPS